VELDPRLKLGAELESTALSIVFQVDFLYFDF